MESRRAFSHSGILYASLPMIPFGILPLVFLEYHTVPRSSQRRGCMAYRKTQITKHTCMRLHMYVAETNICADMKTITCATTWLNQSTCVLKICSDS